MLYVKQSSSADKWTDVIKKCDNTPIATFETKFGMLYEGDCLSILPFINNESVDMVFADPPYNLGKNYGKNVNDSLSEDEYVNWSKLWIASCVRILKKGGSLFLYNLPKWNIIFGNYLLHLGMLFRHWIVIDIKLGLPIPKRLYPSHYSMLYFTKGNPKTFNKIRIPIAKCRHCKKEIKDYGGHKKSLNNNGLNLADVWNDIPPVRHKKFKGEYRQVNQLSTKLLQRAILLSTNEDDIILDPFGGSGTTYYVCEMLSRRWIGIEIQDCGLIIDRIKNNTIIPHKSYDFVDIQ